jgi:hypothetical protein
MCEADYHSQQREIIVASGAGVLWAALGVAISLWLNAEAHATPCRVHNLLSDGTANVGSGTLIDVAADGQRGLVLTCAHLFTEGVGRVAIEFPGSQTHGAVVVAVDPKADLAALEIAKPAVQPAQVSSQFEPTAMLRACGFGPSGSFRCVQGQALGYSEGPGQTSVRMAGAVRSGDSGGGVFDGQGKLCGVVWGESGGVTYASTGKPLAAFLNRVLSARRGAAATPPRLVAPDCPDGRCPLLPPAGVGRSPTERSPAVIAMPPLGGTPSTDRPLTAPAGMCPAGDCKCEDQFAALAARLDNLRPDASQQPVSSSSSNLSRAARTAALIAISALGISGPAGWGVIAAASVGGWLIGQRLKRRRQRVGHSPQLKSAPSSSLASQASRLTPSAEATAAAETSFPIERDDREARELLRLSQLEGRDPLQDAVAGRLALDRLDALAEGDADPSQATWADRLRRELRERFNEIAPTKFQIKAES